MLRNEVNVEDLPGNSHRERRAAPVGGEPEKKLEKVVTGPVSRRKKPLGTRFAETIFGGDGKGVLHYILLDVLLPAAKDTIADVVTQGIERALFGEARSSSRRTGSRAPSPSSYVSYNRYSNSPISGRPGPASREVDRRDRANDDYDQYTLRTRPEAEEVLRRMDHLIEQYGSASKADLHELLGLESRYTDEKWGWTEFGSGSIRRVRDGYLLELPPLESLR